MPIVCRLTQEIIFLAPLERYGLECVNYFCRPGFSYSCARREPV